MIQSSTTELRKDDPKDYQNDHATQHQDLRVLPPHLTPHCPCASSKSGCLTCHMICLIHQKLYPLATAQDLFDVLDHDVFDLVQLVLRTLQLIFRGCSVVGPQEIADYRPERTLKAVCRDVIRAGGRWCAEETSLEFSQESEGHSPASSIFCHDEICEATFSNIVKQVVLQDVSHLAVIWWDLR